MVYNPYQKYQTNNIMTAPPEELTLMLYNGAIKFCNQALEAIEQKNISVANEGLIKAQNIISELQCTLNPDYPISKEFDRMYEFIKELLTEANLRKEPKPVEDALMFIREFRDLWKEVMIKAKVK